MPIPLAGAIIGATALAEGSRHAGNYFANKKAKREQKKQKKSEKESSYRRAKESKRETKAAILEEALKRSTMTEKEKLASKERFGKRRSQNLQTTADLVREAFNI